MALRIYSLLGRAVRAKCLHSVSSTRTMVNTSYLLSRAFAFTRIARFAAFGVRGGKGDAMAPHAPAANFCCYPVLRVFPVIQVNAQALPPQPLPCGSDIIWYILKKVSVITQKEHVHDLSAISRAS